MQEPRPGQIMVIVRQRPAQAPSKGLLQVLISHRSVCGYRSAPRKRVSQMLGLSGFLCAQRVYFFDALVPSLIISHDRHVVLGGDLIEEHW